MKVIKEISRHQPGFKLELNDYLYSENPDLAKAEIKVLSYLFLGKRCSKKGLRKALNIISNAMDTVKGYEIKFVPVDPETGEETGEASEYRRWKGQEIAKERFSYLGWFRIYKKLLGGSK
jgi:hypothetical protein